MARLYSLLAVAFIAALAGGTWFFTRGGETDQFAQCRGSTIASGGDAIGGPFELVNSKGETVTDKDVFTEPSILYFGYTFCPDVCPLDVSRNAEAIDVLAEQGISATPVFVSIDPERDTPEVVGDFAYNMHEKMIGLTGSLEQIKAASRAYKTYFKRQPGDDGYYLVDHSTFAYLVLPEIGFVDFFRRDETPEQIADKVSCFVENM
ncbi:SCO family protein [Pseudophaeobacter sp.]|jgi:protein SCO1/2|uniref:SCO family protein n=1 Tax=Pseudophaeobacter arcticus TaxID=385492 RepID=A0ABQ0AG43_9RHOB|nr:SCO family protein [Pseudophaeobacter sp.]UWS79625.1 SCO family protein [Phaeobacter sp. G2]